MSKEQIEAMRIGCPMRHENGNCLVAGGFCTAVNTPICEALHNAYDTGKMHSMEEMKKQGYRKQSENVIELPCKIGETMYVVSRYYTGSWEIFECKVDCITMYGTHTFISLISIKGNFVFGENVSSINKNVFFTKEEAEQVFAKMKGGAE